MICLNFLFDVNIFKVLFLSHALSISILLFRIYAIVKKLKPKIPLSDWEKKKVKH